MANSQTATFAGGCFWCTEAIFSRLKGVIKVTPGYAGGVVVNPTYQQVSSGRAGHAESVQIDFDPSQITYSTLLNIFWDTHDPTQLNRQGADIGSQYRSVIFTHTQDQAVAARKSKIHLESSNKYPTAVVTQIVPFSSFYPAEEEHKNYYFNNRSSQYCRLVIDPKIAKFMNRYSDIVLP